MRSSYCLARFKRLSITTLLVGLLATPVAAQTFGAQVGVSIDPDQFYFGGHVQTPPVVDRLHFRPNVEIGIGDDITLIGFNMEFVYRFPTQRAWELYAGGGPALNVIKTSGETHSEGGFNVLIGMAHRDGLFVEVKGGAMDSPNFKLGVGYVFR
jgi:hypothetical protein